MTRVLLDTNVVLDFLLDRIPFAIAIDWRSAPKQYSLQHADLQDVDLSNRDFRPREDGGQGLDLSYSKLLRANLSNANLENAQLVRANLSYAIVRQIRIWASRSGIEASAGFSGS